MNRHEIYENSAEHNISNAYQQHIGDLPPLMDRHNSMNNSKDDVFSRPPVPGINGLPRERKHRFSGGSPSALLRIKVEPGLMGYGLPPNGIKTEGLSFKRFESYPPPSSPLSLVAGAGHHGHIGHLPHSGSSGLTSAGQHLHHSMRRYSLPEYKQHQNNLPDADNLHVPLNLTHRSSSSADISPPPVSAVDDLRYGYRNHHYQSAAVVAAAANLLQHHPDVKRELPDADLEQQHQHAALLLNVSRQQDQSAGGGLDPSVDSLYRDYGRQESEDYESHSSPSNHRSTSEVYRGEFESSRTNSLNNLTGLENPVTAKKEPDQDSKSGSSGGSRGSGRTIIEFDGNDCVLCRVCGDKASGFHYGVHSCEGCKGFFRRSIQQKIQYRPCNKNQQCSILRINRNRCQYCRLKKCISAGMSRDAVRFGRVPKREKAKILAAMQSSKAKVLESRVLTEMADDRKIIDTIVRAHYDTCDYTVEKIKPFVSRAHANPKLTQCSGQRCPLKGSPEMSFLDEFSDRFMDHVRQVCTFAKLIPGFKCLQHDDQVTLLKSCVFEVLTVRLSGLFDNQSLVCMNGDVIRRETISAMPAGNAKFLMDNVFELTQRINRFSLSDAEIGLFCAVVIISADRPGLRNPELVGRMQTKLKNILQSILVPQHPHHTAIFTELVAITQDLRTLNTLHTEKFLLQAKVLRDEVVGSASPLPPTSTATIVGQSYVDREWEDNTNSLDRDSTGSRSPQSSSDSPATSHSFSMEDLRRSPLGSVSSSESIANSETFSKLSVNDLKIHGSVLLNALTSPALSQQLGAAAANSASQQLHQHQPLPAGGSGSLAQQQQHHIQNLNQSSNSSSSRKRDLSSRNENVRSSESRHQQQTQAEDSSCSSASGSIGAPESKCPYKARKLDSPSDSGIDSPKAQGSHSTNTSVCSSPRSSMEENQGGEDSERPDLEEQHPLLKRALQQPPQPFNMGGVANFQDEVYKPHKKFRHSDRKDGDEPTSSTQDGAPGAVSPSSSLVHTHSILASQLAAPPTYQRRPSPPPSALSSALSSSNGNSNACNVSSSQQQAGSSSAGVTTLSSHAGTYHLHPQSLLATTLSRPVAVQRAKRDEERSELLANLILDSGRYRPSLSSSHHLSHHQKSQSSLLMCAITSPASSPLPAHTASESRPWSPASSGSSAVSAAPQQPAVGSRHLPVPVAPSHSTSSTAGSGLAALSTAAAAQKKLLHDNSAATAAFRGASDSEDFMPLNLCVKSGDGPSAPAVTNSTAEAQEQLCTAAVKKEPIGTSGAM